VVASRSQTLQSTGIVRDAIDLTRFPWIRPLVNDYATNFESVRALYAGDPSDPAAWRDTIARVQRAPRDRAAISAVLGHQLESRQSPP
jgi:hypothetical protein